MGNFIRQVPTTDDSEPYRDGTRQQRRLDRRPTIFFGRNNNITTKLNDVETNESPQLKEYEKLNEAISEGDLKQIRLLLRSLGSKNPIHGQGTNALHTACTCGNPEISLLIAENHSCFDLCDLHTPTNSYPLLEAARRHDTVFFDTLMKAPDSSESYAANSKKSFASMADSEGNTLLHIAANNEEISIVKFALDFGLDPWRGNNKGVTPLHFAAMRGNENIAKLLLYSEKVSDNMKSYITAKAAGVCNETPFYFAAKFNHPNMISFLLERYSQAGGNEQELIEQQTALGFTPLLSAVRFTNPKCVTVLLEKGANILAKDKKRNLNALLWAVVVQSPKMIKEILSHVKGSNMKVWIETDPQGNTAHHLAAETSNLAVLETLASVNKSCLEVKNNNGLTPLHTGAKIGKQEMVNFIISNAPGTTYLSDNDGNSVLHIAAERGHEVLVECLMDTHNFGLIVGARNSSHGMTPLHLAAQNGHYSVLAFLLSHQQTPEMAIEITDHRQRTALYLACEEGHSKCVEVLLNGGAKVTYCIQVAGGYQDCTSDDYQRSIKSCMGIAIQRRHRAVVSAILRHSSWKQGLRVTYPSHLNKENRNRLPNLQQPRSATIDRGQMQDQLEDENINYGTTPFRELIKSIPDLAMVVLDKCRKEADNGERDYNYEFIEDFPDLFMDDECPKFHSGTFVTKNESASRPRSHRPLSQTVSQSRTTTTDATDHHEPTAQPCQDCAWGPKKYYYWNHPLQLMVEHQRERLLSHPVVKTFIRRKWYRLGAWIFYFNVLLYATLMILLTAYMYLHFDLTMSLRRSYYANDTKEDIDAAPAPALSNCSVSFDKQDYHEVRKRLMITIASIIVIICLSRIIVELFQLSFYSGEYLTSWINLIEGFLYVGTIIFVLSDFEYTCLNSWRWQLGALCIFLSWINFVLFMSKEPTFGIYVVMFQEVLKTFLKTIPMSTLLIFAFGQPFYMLLSPVIVENEPSTMPFQNLGYSLLKTVTMTIGEFDEVDHILYRYPNVLEFEFSTYLLWLIFVIVMAILLQNMLVGLAVDNIKLVLAQAALEKEALQIEFLLKLTNIQCIQYLIRRFNSAKGQRRAWKGWKWFRTQMITLSLCRGRDDKIQQHRCLRSRSYKPPKDPIEVVLQQHFQKVDERCDRLEKLILKQITEQKYLQQGKRNDLGMKSRTLSLLSVDDDPSTSFDPRSSQGYSNELFRESSPVEIETDI